jgi:hypothetical protein
VAQLLSRGIHPNQRSLHISHIKRDHRRY